VPLVRVVSVGGLVVFGVLAVVASVSVGNRFDPLPLAIIVVTGGLSALYTVRQVPRLRAAEAARRAATGRRRPARAPGTSPTPTEGPPAPAPTEPPAPVVP